ncbi:maleylpyruvate isomerase family mycothiol-dependent enzyme [Kitasatospora sp. NPDC056327]|uniref:maleylpyruvate isomerase family mycothiol-dependent enzyme n=1 Tax=Kitasatospora sp. NPDC056327 TaxID=3345785 RepID=UPI0035DE37A8
MSDARAAAGTGPGADLAADFGAGVRAAVAAERRELAEVFESLPVGDWGAPSLCEGWRVREVVAHMSTGFRLSLPRMLGEMVRARGNLHRMTDRVARRDAAAYSPDQLCGFLRDNADHPWTPPVGGVVAALAHDVVHGLDVTVALGLERKVPEDRLSVLLDAVRPRDLRFFGVDLTGVRLVADDLAWSCGHGDAVSGSAQDLLLVTFGRRLPPGRLHGGPSSRFTTR